MWIIDRIEEDVVILEDEVKNIVSINKEKILLENLCEGDVLKKDENDNYILDKEATENRKKYIEEVVINDLWEN